MKNLVIVESPAKARTISKFLGRDYKVLASMGHVRDLPKSNLGFDPDDNFKPKYQISRDKTKIIKELKSQITKETVIYLAADEDREGEAIAWHLIPALKCEKNPIKRIVFHEITKPAILHAIKNPRDIDQNLVDAQQARRILDRAVGYKLSPLIWKKVRYGLSAGRVQSVAVRIIVDKENERRAFVPEEFWTITANFTQPKFEAVLAKIDGKAQKVTNETQATQIKLSCDSSKYIVQSIEQKQTKSHPSAPYTTSTLQQDASTKLGFSVKQTMVLSQKLYEGSINIPNHTGGLITYMRTDSVSLSATAISATNEAITCVFGSDYNIKAPRVYSSKTKGAQEAHEAIRPVNMMLYPKDIKSYLDSNEFRLYSLIWKRTMATQMKEATIANTTYKITAGEKSQYEFQAKGKAVVFDGYMAVYMFDNDKSNTDLFLPKVEKSAELTCETLDTVQKFTKPPSRYTEASLVKKLEALGIGRPSTYAPTISTIQQREYVIKTEDKKLKPAPIGEVVDGFLVEHFANIVDTGFTAKVEESFDLVANGKITWQEVLREFYEPFAKNIEDKEANAPRAKFNDSRVLGDDPKTGKQISTNTGRFGPYVQLGKKEDTDENGKEIKPKFASLPKGMSVDKITLKQALVLLQLPRSLGVDSSGKDIKVNIGRFGPYVQVGSNYYNIKDDDPYTISLDRAMHIIAEQDKAKAQALVKEFVDDDIQILDGRYGYYIKHKKKNYKLPKKLSREELEELNLEQTKEYISQTPKKKKYAKK